MFLNRLVFLSLIMAFITMPYAVYAQDGNQENYDKRIGLAQQILAVNPVRDQVRGAIEQFVARAMPMASQADKETLKFQLIQIINVKAIEDVSLRAYADVFTQSELEVMLDYYSKPEAKTAREKMPQLNEIIGPEIVKMLDKAVMKARTTRPN